MHAPSCDVHSGHSSHVSQERRDTTAKTKEATENHNKWKEIYENEEEEWGEGKKKQQHEKIARALCIVNTASKPHQSVRSMPSIHGDAICYIVHGCYLFYLHSHAYRHQNTRRRVVGYFCYVKIKEICNEKERHPLQSLIQWGIATRRLVKPTSNAKICVINFTLAAHSHLYVGEIEFKWLQQKISWKKKQIMVKRRSKIHFCSYLTQSFESDLGLLNVWILSPRRDWTIACTALVLNIFTYFSSSFLSLATRFDIFGLILSIGFAAFMTSHSFRTIVSLLLI